MLKHIVTAVDFTTATPQLYARLQELRSWGTTRVTLVHVLSTRYPQAPDEGHREHYDRLLKAAARELGSQGLQVDWQVRSGSPAAEIVAAAREVDADTILTGTRSQTRLGDRFFGSTALNLARLADRPLWLEPVFKEPAVQPIQTMLLATDGSPSANGAGQAFRELRSKADRAIVLTVAKDGVRQPETLHSLPDVESRVDTGDPRERIVEIAREVNTGLVIVGKRGHTALHDLMLGSTAESVCRRTQRPVLLIP